VQLPFRYLNYLIPARVDAVGRVARSLALNAWLLAGAFDFLGMASPAAVNMLVSDVWKA
jgi:hypothetical protein